jgi:uncharacterized membrane protein
VPTVSHTVEINKPPSTVFKMLRDANNIKAWAPVVTDSYCSEPFVNEGTPFSVKADLKPVGGPKFEFDNVVAKLVDDKELVWRQTKGTMKRLEWHFHLEPIGTSQNPDGEATMLSLTIDYDMPYSFLGSIMDKVKMNRVITAACRVNLEGLKRKIEA